MIFSITDDRVRALGDEAGVEEVAGEHAEQPVAELLVVDRAPARPGSSSQLRERARRARGGARATRRGGRAARARTGCPASSYACRLCGESSSERMCVKPWPISQISSSWRRTLRWLRANPPGRSDAASRSLMIQQNAARLEPLRPPTLHATASASMRVHHVEQPDARRRPRATSCTRTIARALRRTHQTAVASVPSSRASTGVVAERARPMNDLRDGPTSTGTSTRSTSSRRRASSVEVVRRRSCRTRCPGSAHSDVGGDARRTRAASSRATRKSPTSATTSSYVGRVLHRAGLALHVHHDEPGAGVGDHAEHVRVGARRRRR